MQCIATMLLVPLEDRYSAAAGSKQCCYSAVEDPYSVVRGPLQCHYSVVRILTFFNPFFNFKKVKKVILSARMSV